MTSFARVRAATVAVAVLAGMVVPALPAAAVPTTYTVTKVADTADGTCNADCSLREAITAANANPGQDTIVLPAGDYVLSIVSTAEDGNVDGDLDVADDLVIRGAGDDVTTIDADGNFDGLADGDHRVFEVLDRVSLGLVGVTVTGGDAYNDGNIGGGILVGESGALTLSDVTVTGNRSTSNGGGIYLGDSGGVLVAEDSAIDGNQGSDGGGLYVDYATVTLRRVSVDGNTATNSGGGLFHEESSTIRGWDVTFDDNAAADGGGAYLDSYGPTFQCHDCSFSDNTVTGDGGGLYAYEQSLVELWDTDIVRNTATGGSPDGVGLYAYYASVVAHDSLISTNRATNGTSTLYGAGLYAEYSAIELHGTPVRNNVHTTTLSAYGTGAYVYYGHLLLEDSPITGNRMTVNSGGYGGGLYAEYASVVASGTTRFTDNRTAHGDGAADLYGGGIYGYYGSLQLTGTATDPIEVEDNVLTAGASGSYGGGVYLDNAGLEGSHVAITGNEIRGTNSAYGGGVYNYYGSLRLSDTSITENVTGTGDSTSGYGGGVYSEYGSNLFERVHLDDNSATQDGGGYSGTYSNLTLRDSTVARNVARNPEDASDNTYGGGLSMDDDYGTILIEGSTIEDNVATYQGGGILLYDSPLTIRDSVVRNNRVESPAGDNEDVYGGGISTEYCCSALIIERTLFEGNSAVADDTVEGGAIHAYQSAVHVEDSTFIDNVARSRHTADDTEGGLGGAIFLDNDDSPLEVHRSLFVGNRALGGGGAGGAVYGDDGAQAVLTNTTLSDNDATHAGGAVYLEDASVLRSTQSSFVGNSTEAAASGGAIAIETDTGTPHAALRGTLFEGNTANGVADSCGGDPVTSNGYNLSDDDTCGLDVSSDQEDTVADTLGLAANGGPTMTHALPATSPAVDAGGADCTDLGGVLANTVDQRGAGRPVDGDGDATVACDVGAFELATAVTVVATDAEADEGGDTGTFTVTRAGTDGDLTVAYTVSGSATPGADYGALGGTVVIPDGAASATITVTPVADAVDDADETVIVTIDPDVAYAVGTPSSATVTIGEAGPATVTRVAGDDRVMTAIQVSNAAFASADTVLIARSNDFADALAGAPLAAQVEGPVLLTRPSELQAPVLAEIQRLGAANVIILGGTAAVSQDVEDALKAENLNVTRRAGLNRFETAGVIANDVGGTSVYVAKGVDPVRPDAAFADALGVSALAAYQEQPILLVGGDSVPQATLDALDDLGATDATIIGGPGAISDGVEATLDGAVADVDRLFGATRFATSVAIAQAGATAGMSLSTVWLGNGLNWPDALTAGPAVGHLGHTMLLVHPSDLDRSPEIRDFLADNTGAISAVNILGGVGAIAQAVEDAILAIVGI